MLTENRKLYSILTSYDPDYVFPQPPQGPVPVYLTEPKTVGERTYTAGEIDPDWKTPDVESIWFGPEAIDGRWYYSIRADIDTTATSEITDPQNHETVSEEIYTKLSECSLKDVKRAEGDITIDSLMAKLGVVKGD